MNQIGKITPRCSNCGSSQLIQSIDPNGKLEPADLPTIRCGSCGFELGRPDPESAGKAGEKVLADLLRQSFKARK